MGEVCMIPPGLESCLGQRMVLLRPNCSVVNARYLLYALQTSEVQTAIQIQGGTGSTVSNLRIPVLEALQVPLPPTKLEQQRIAEALSDADALIEGLGQLISKKLEVKQGAMQNLLRPADEWIPKSLKEIVETPITDGPHLTPRFLENGVPFLSVNNLVDNKVDLKDLRFISKEDHELFSRKCKPRKGDILLGKAASVGKVAVVETDVEFNIWSPIALIRVGKKYDKRFIYYQLQSADASKQIALLTNSSSQGNIGMSDIERLVVKAPLKEEQTAIATVLSDMDAEIAGLEVKLDKARRVKEGMMQDLLTGKVRLV